MTTVSELPVWRNIIARTVVYYAITLTAAWYAHGLLPLALDATSVGAIDQLLSGTTAPGNGSALVAPGSGAIPTAIATAIAMLTAFLSSLPVGGSTPSRGGRRDSSSPWCRRISSCRWSRRAS